MVSKGRPFTPGGFTALPSCNCCFPETDSTAQRRP